MPSERLAAARAALLSYVYSHLPTGQHIREVPAGGLKVVFLSVSCHFLGPQDQEEFNGTLTSLS